MSDTRTFDFFGDTLAISWDGNMWVSPVNGQQHSRIGEAVQVECEFYIRASGDDPEDYTGPITDAVNEAANPDD